MTATVAYAMAASRPWTPEERQRAINLRRDALHLGEVAEALGRTVIELVCELGLGEDDAHGEARRHLVSLISSDQPSPRERGLQVVRRVASERDLPWEVLLLRSQDTRVCRARWAAYTAMSELLDDAGERVLSASAIAFLMGTSQCTVRAGIARHRRQGGA